MKPNIINLAGYMIITTAIVLIVYIAALIFVPPVIIKPQNQPYKVVNHQLKAGSTLYYEANVCKYADSPAYVNRLISGQVNYSLPETTNHIPPGCAKSIVGVMIPSFVQPGKYILHLDIRYEVNFIRHENYHLTTEQFEVLDAE